uniref:Uncharacterized protein n=1 Tax=Geospiza parvula TaxID=87175 RepID=A0A8U8BJU7_GEOPR
MEEHLASMAERLRHELPNFFLKIPDYGLYAPDVEFQCQHLHLHTRGRAMYAVAVALCRALAWGYFASLRLEVLALTRHPEDWSVRARWRLTGLPLHLLLLRWYRRDKRTLLRYGHTWDIPHCHCAIPVSPPVSPPVSLPLCHCPCTCCCCAGTGGTNGPCSGTDTPGSPPIVTVPSPCHPLCHCPCVTAPVSLCHPLSSPCHPLCHPLVPPGQMAPAALSDTPVTHLCHTCVTPRHTCVTPVPPLSPEGSAPPRCPQVPPSMSPQVLRRPLHLLPQLPGAHPLPPRGQGESGDTLGTPWGHLGATPGVP